jgi:hypothetical protein
MGYSQESKIFACFLEEKTLDGNQREKKKKKKKKPKKKPKKNKKKASSTDIGAPGPYQSIHVLAQSGLGHGS